MSAEIKKILFIIFGVIVSVIIPILGLYLTNIFEDGFAVTMSLIVLSFIGFLTYKSKYKLVGIGIFIGLIPISLLAFMFIIVSKLH
jgi:hypothetical protein